MVVEGSTSPQPSLSATATLSHRGAKPFQRVELIVTVRHANDPLIQAIERSRNIRIHPVRGRQLLRTSQGEVWLFRYWITPTAFGEYEIPPIRVVDPVGFALTKPLLLHVSKKGEPPVLSPRELSLGVDLPPSLSEEVLKAAPQPTPKPEPTPPPQDARPFPAKAASSILHALKAFWDDGR